MKWFKHYTDHSSLKPQIYRIQDRLGLKGYARTYQLIEIIVSQMERKEDGPIAKFPIKVWCKFLNTNQKGLSQFFKTLKEFELISYKGNINQWEVEFHNLRGLLDNQAISSKSRKASGLLREEEEIEQEEKRDRVKNPIDINNWSSLKKTVISCLNSKKPIDSLCERLLDHWVNNGYQKSDRLAITRIVERQFADTEKARGFCDSILSEINEIDQLFLSLYTSGYYENISPNTVRKLFQNRKLSTDEDEFYQSVRESFCLNSKKNADQLAVFRAASLKSKKIEEWLPRYETEYLNQVGSDTERKNCKRIGQGRKVESKKDKKGGALWIDDIL